MTVQNHASLHIPFAGPDMAVQGAVFASAFIGLSVGYSATYFWSSGLFLLPVAADLGLGRAQASLGPLCSWMAAAVAIPLYGRLLDRVGAHVIAIMSLVGLAMGYLLLAYFAVDLPTYLLCSLATAILGSGSTALPYSRLLFGVFTRRRGLALGMALIGTGLTAIFLPLLLTPIIASMGWRMAYAMLACLVLLCALVIAALLVPLGGAARPVRPEPAATSSVSAPLLKDRSFTLIGMAFLAMALGSITIVVHFVAMITDAGISLHVATMLASIMGFSSLGARVCTGLMLDRFSPEKVAIALVAVAGVGVACLLVITLPTLFFAALAIGFLMGAEVDMLAFLTARHFQPGRYGEAFGGLFALFLIGGAVGPLIAGAVFDRTGDYHLALLGALAALGVSALLLQLQRRSTVPHVSSGS